MMATIEHVPSPLLPSRLTLDGIPARPAVRRWARALVREIRPMTRPLPQVTRRRLLAIFIDGLGARTLERAAREGRMRFLGALRDCEAMRESRTFSGMPSTTTAFQAGLFYGLRHPDMPAFNWFDRRQGSVIQMNKPTLAAREERRVRDVSGQGLMTGGSSYLSILRGGAEGHLNTAGAGELLLRGDAPVLDPERLPAASAIHSQTAFAVAARLALETGSFLADMAKFVRFASSTRHELNFLLNHLLLGTLTKEVAQGQALHDLIRGVPRIFVNLHDYDETSHRRGARWAEGVLPRIDQAVEALVAVAAAVPDPPDVWIFSDHGQIEALPFERLFGTTLREWLLGAGDGARRPPELPASVLEATRARPEPTTGLTPTPRTMDLGDYAHVYLDGEVALDSAEIVRRHSRTLARALSCPGIGLTVMRHRGGAIAFAGGRRVDPADPSTVPAGASPRAVAAILDELPSSPSSGDLVLYGSWLDGSCVAPSWEYSSHGGPSPGETETFVIHPAGVPFDVERVEHAADLHRIFLSLYGDDLRGGELH